MLHVKSCNVKHNSESIYRYFASAVNSDKSTKCNRKDLYAICNYSSLKKSRLWLPCTPFAKFCLIYSDWAFEITLCSLSTRLDQPCAVQIHLLGIRDTPDNCSVRYRELSLYDFTL